MAKFRQLTTTLKILDVRIYYEEQKLIAFSQGIQNS